MVELSRVCYSLVTSFRPAEAEGYPRARVEHAGIARDFDIHGSFLECMTRRHKKVHQYAPKRPSRCAESGFSWLLSEAQGMGGAKSGRAHSRPNLGVRM